MIIANFCKGDTTKTIYGLWQWNYGQVLRIQGLDLPTAVEIHFSLQSKGGEAVTRIGTTKDGITDVTIPDSMLENNSSAADYVIYAFVYLTDETSGQTEYKICMQVKTRPKPEAFDTPEDTELFREAIQQVNDSADRAEAAEKAAEGYADKAAEDAEKTAQDREEVERLVESVSGIDDDVKLVAEYKQAAQTAAKDADTSAKAAKTAQTAAETAQKAAETAQKAAETVAKEAAEDKTAVEQAKADVQTMQSQVAQDKADVEQTKTSFTLTAQQAIANVNNAGQTQTDRVEDTGDAAVQGVNTAKTQAVQEVSSAGATQVDTVQAEGDTQVSRVQAAAQEIVADREQIQQNAQDITNIQQELVLKAPAIIQSASGNPAIVQDSSEAPIQDLTMQGWTKQDSTTGANMLSNNPENWEIQKKVSWGAIPGTSISPLEMSLYYATIKFAVKPSTKYSFKNIETKNLWLARIVETDDNNIGWKNHAMYGNVNTQNKETYTFTTTENTTAVYVSVRTLPETGDGESRDITESDIVNNKICFCFNEGEPKYEPYTGGQPSPSPDYPQEIVSAGDWDGENEKYRYEIKIAGKNILDFSKTQDIANWVASVSQVGYSDFPVYVGAGKTVTISIPEKLNTGIILYVGAVLRKQGPIKTWMYHRNEENLIRRVITVTAVEDYIWIRCIAQAISTTFQENFGQLMIEYGTEATAYEPYKSQTITLTSDRPLTEWDRLEKRNGQWGWVYGSKESVLDGSENWKISAGSFWVRIQGIDNGGTTVGKGYSMHYFYSSNVADDLSIWIGRGGYSDSLWIHDSRFSNAEELSEWLAYKHDSGDPVLILAHSPEETFTPLQDSEQAALNALHSNYPTTILSNEQNCDMSLSYIADTANYINKAIHGAIQASIANNLLSANSTQALSAKMGAELNSRLEALEE